ncbi:MAG TPA: trypsin-like peptidase domain-containing protein [Phycisphaerales bacterium]|nr:trypsin-like peptidase domain-containing protein [Phycisphaerales bacterium]
MLSRLNVGSVALVAVLALISGCATKHAESHVHAATEATDGHVMDSRVHTKPHLHPECPVCNLYTSHREGIVRIVTASGQGSGVVVTSTGDILTSAHVVTDQDVVLVSTWGGSEFAGTVVAKDVESDLAVVRVTQATTWKPIELEIAETTPVGSKVFVIGHPVGLGWTVSQGIISAERRAKEIAPTALIQTDAAVSPGNSGGALLAEDGHLLGIIRSKLVGQGIENVSFAVPLADVQVFLARVPPRS